jgi:23S rRNA (cytidine1920-2'-O)/16S rRNA (cytidine1409-2'-O)-methyltransferase
MKKKDTRGLFLIIANNMGHRCERSRPHILIAIHSRIGGRKPPESKRPPWALFLCLERVLQDKPHDGAARLDRALVERGLARSRAEAQEMIADGCVTVDGKPAVKASSPTSPAARIEVAGGGRVYVSRGGLKLAAALDHFAVPIAGRAALDVGASTGGFTDCLLRRGAAHVTAIDVGHGQMTASLAADERITLHEGINARDLKPDDFGRVFDVIVADLSFISLRLVIPALAPLLAADGDMICLVKPQFEAGAAAVGKGGIVRDERARRRAVDDVAAAAFACGLAEIGRMPSPIAGGDGNIEFLLHLRRAAAKDSDARV